MQTVAQSWLVYRLTGSGLQLGAVGFASQIPVFLFAPLGGIVADRSNRKHVVIGTQVASMVLAFVLAALTLFTFRQSVARVCAGCLAGCRKRLRYSRTAIIPGGHGGER